MFINKLSCWSINNTMVTNQSIAMYEKEVKLLNKSTKLLHRFTRDFCLAIITYTNKRDVSIRLDP